MIALLGPRPFEKEDPFDEGTLGSIGSFTAPTPTDAPVEIPHPAESGLEGQAAVAASAKTPSRD